MTKTSDTVVAEAPAEDAAEFNKLDAGSHLYRAYVLDVDTNPDNPVLVQIYKRGDEYPDVQSRIRAILKGEGAEGDRVFSDLECTQVFNPKGDDGEPDPSWNLTLVRKQRGESSTRGKGGVDREWLRMVLADPNKSAEEKIAAMAKFV